MPPNWGNSFLIVLKQWGQCVMTLRNRYCLIASMFSCCDRLVEILLAQPPADLRVAALLRHHAEAHAGLLRIFTTERAIAWLRRS